MWKLLNTSSMHSVSIHPRIIVAIIFNDTLGKIIRCEYGMLR